MTVEMPHSTAGAATASGSTDAHSTLTSALDTVSAFPTGAVSLEALSTALQRINLALEGKFPPQIAELVSEYNIRPEPFIALFPYAPQDEILKTITRIVDKLLTPMSYQDIQAKYGQLLLLGLDHPSGPVRHLVLAALGKATSSEETTKMLLRSNFFMPLLECLAFPDVDVGLRVQEIVYQIAQTHAGLQILLTEDAVSIFNQLLTENETIKFRVYDVAIRISTISDQALQMCRKSELLKSLVDDLHSPDVLSRLNVVQTFTKLLDADAGYCFLESMGVLGQMSGLLEAEVSNIDDVLVVCAVVKFFAHAAGTRPADFDAIRKSYSIFEHFDRQLSSSRQELREAVVRAIGNIGATSRGLSALNDQKTLLNDFLDQGRSSTGDMKITAMQSASCLIGVRSTVEFDTSDIAQRVFLEIAGQHNPLANLLRYAKAAFLDSRIAAYAIFKAMAVHEWALHEINNTYEFVAFLLDRQIEPEVVGKEWKYSIVQAIVSHPKAGHVLDENIVTRFQRYVREGPFFKDVEPVVAFESA